MKNNARGGGLLHSHIQRYPPGASGSEQQQITCYSHKDVNNNWIVIAPANETMPAEGEIRYLYEGDIIRLEHEQTKHLLHSHSLAAPITKSQWEVSGYGKADIDDPNDLWKVEIIKDDRPKSTKERREVRSLTTRFALRHVRLGCLLHSGDGVNYPEWGFKQAEVYCEKKDDPSSLGNLWNVEQHWNSLLPPGGAAAYPSNFWRDFVDLNVAMWTTNNALTPDDTKEPDALTSKPLQWPFMEVGLRMCGWGDNELKFYLLGNPIVWIGSSVGLHHYFPALYFAIILFAFIVDHLGKRVGKVLHTFILLALSTAVIGVFVYFSDFAFGMDGPAEQWKARQWRSTWNIYG
ncbi:Protein O-mannosyltransferase 2 [Physocladia obscura]|uniref:Dolichyl-phosphate-mannose--protein mannosyltransferase n=1 Tax=Physocladia obscura TaxID=109957 RepID=A0AAD5XE39_9FUNG|nr:Protein O-mannosyltransferase 2 [Physocladia obscura]